MTKKPSPEIEKPLACPFCGRPHLSVDAVYGPWRVMCQKCGALGPIKQWTGDAIKAWNRRLAKRSTRGKGKREQA